MITGIFPKKEKRSTISEAILFSGASLGSLSKTIANGLEKELYKLNASSRKDLSVALHNKIAFSRKIYERNRNKFGRMLNWIFGESSKGNIEISGIELIALLSILNETADIKIDEKQSYWIPFEVAQNILAKLEN